MIPYSLRTTAAALTPLTNYPLGFESAIVDALDVAIPPGTPLSPLSVGGLSYFRMPRDGALEDVAASVALNITASVNLDGSPANFVFTVYRATAPDGPSPPNPLPQFTDLIAQVPVTVPIPAGIDAFTTVFGANSIDLNPGVTLNEGDLVALVVSTPTDLLTLGVLLAVPGAVFSAVSNIV